MRRIISGNYLNTIRTIELFVTDKCNMDCKYCYHKKGESVLSFTQGKRILKRIHELSPGGVRIVFFGGEPLLYPKTVLALASYESKFWNKEKNYIADPLFSVCTNGTYFNKMIFSKFKDLGFLIQVSCDGDEFTNMIYRKANWKEIFSNIKKMRLLFPNLVIHLTYTPKTVKYLHNNVRFLHEQLAVQDIMHQAVIEGKWTESSIAEYSYQLAQLFYYRRECLRRGAPLRLHFIDKALQTIHKQGEYSLDYCAAGKSQIAIRPNGDIYPCHRAASISSFKIGNVFNSIPIDNNIFSRVSKHQNDGCRKCKAAAICHSCIIAHYNENNDILHPTSNYCKICKVEYSTAKHFLPAEFDPDKECKLYA